jgi:hypothetical protein
VENTCMNNDMLKLVRYRVLFVKRGLEHAFEDEEELVPDNLDESAYKAWKIAEFVGQLGVKERPAKWRDKNYPAGDGGDKIGNLPEEDTKYLRVHFRVLSRHPREKLKARERKIQILEEIRDRIPSQASNAPPQEYMVRLPKTMCLGGVLNPAESQFGDQFFNFPAFLGQKPKPGETNLAGWVTIQFSKPSGPLANFTINFNGVGTDDEIKWGNGQTYHFLRDQAIDDLLPFPGDVPRNVGTLNL